MDPIEHGQQLALDLADELAAYGGSLIPTLFVYRQIAEKSEIPEHARAKARALLPEHEGAVEAARSSRRTRPQAWGEHRASLLDRWSV